MGRGAKPAEPQVKAKTKPKARPPLARKSRKGDPTGRRPVQSLAEALEQQAATSEILRVISESPTDAQPVFETIVKAALKLCRAIGRSPARTMRRCGSRAMTS